MLTTYTDEINANHTIRTTHLKIIYSLDGTAHLPEALQKTAKYLLFVQFGNKRIIYKSLAFQHTRHSNSHIVGRTYIQTISENIHQFQKELKMANLRNGEGIVNN